jgi:hypothetical protein
MAITKAENISRSYAVNRRQKYVPAPLQPSSYVLKKAMTTSYALYWAVFVPKPYWTTDFAAPQKTGAQKLLCLKYISLVLNTLFPKLLQQLLITLYFFIYNNKKE